jgi:hypothetical protein
MNKLFFKFETPPITFDMTQENVEKKRLFDTGEFLKRVPKSTAVSIGNVSFPLNVKELVHF